MSKILILGGDGYLGWPTTMHFSALGHKVYTLDNFSKRKKINELIISNKQISNRNVS